MTEYENIVKKANVAVVLSRNTGQVLTYKEIRDALSDYRDGFISDLTEINTMRRRATWSDDVKYVFPEISDKELISILVDLGNKGYVLPGATQRGWYVMSSIDDYISRPVPADLVKKALRRYRQEEFMAGLEKLSKPKKPTKQ
ncbi:MAG TPA: hypothetical protein VI968_01770 [archaeon]|nr:hypothetical protein [archaeon]